MKMEKRQLLLQFLFFADESLGTVKLFTALPYLFDVLEHGGALVIDELENGLHLSLAKEIINLFTSEKTNPHHAQLICTSHQPLLVDGNYRRDQVWITAKDPCGKSSLHRMSDLKTSRAKVNLANRILEGAFGCNPDLFFNNNTSKEKEKAPSCNSVPCGMTEARNMVLCHNALLLYHGYYSIAI